MHITFLHPAIDFSDGTERLQASVRAARDAGARVSVLAGKGARLASLLDLGAEVHLAELPETSLRGFFAARRTRALLGELAPDLLHATGQGIIAGASMVLIEFHPNPMAALCDGHQALTPDQLPKLLEYVRHVRGAYESVAGLEL